jgi:hypothetical protein
VRPLNVVVDLNFLIKLVKAMLTRRIAASFFLILELAVAVAPDKKYIQDYLIDAIPNPKSGKSLTIVFIKSMQLHSMAFQLLLSLQMDKVSCHNIV